MTGDLEAAANVLRDEGIDHPLHGHHVDVLAILGHRDRFVDTYFSTIPGTYFCGDGERRDEDGCYWITD